MSKFRCEAASVDGFVQYLACNLINRGYWWYYFGRIPWYKDPHAVDAKLAELYELTLDKFARARRKKKGLANAAYIRHERQFVLICTEGPHRLREDHKLIDIRLRPIHFHGYSIGCGRGGDGRYHASVRIHDAAFLELKEIHLTSAATEPPHAVVERFSRISFQPYARVRRQLMGLWRSMDQWRAIAQLDPLPDRPPVGQRCITSIFRSPEA
jgi:hypothetical protein